MAKNDFRRVKKLGKYLKKEKKRLVLILLILIPVALAGTIQPLLVGQAISVLRGEDTLPYFDNLSNEFLNSSLICFEIIVFKSFKSFAPRFFAN